MPRTQGLPLCDALGKNVPGPAQIRTVPPRSGRQTWKIKLNYFHFFIRNKNLVFRGRSTGFHWPINSKVLGAAIKHTWQNKLLRFWPTVTYLKQNGARILDWVVWWGGGLRCCTGGHESISVGPRWMDPPPATLTQASIHVIHQPKNAYNNVFICLKNFKPILTVPKNLHCQSTSVPHGVDRSRHGTKAPTAAPRRSTSYKENKSKNKRSWRNVQASMQPEWLNRNSSIAHTQILCFRRQWQLTSEKRKSIQLLTYKFFRICYNINRKWLTRRQIDSSESNRTLSRIESTIDATGGVGWDGLMTVPW